MKSYNRKINEWMSENQIKGEQIIHWIDRRRESMSEECALCQDLNKGDTLYKSSDWDSGISFDYIRDIQYCPVCGKALTTWKERAAKRKQEAEGGNTE